MLFMLQVKLAKPSDMSNREFYELWEKEAQVVIAGLTTGSIEAAYKVPGKNEAIIIMNVTQIDDLDQIYHLPITKLGYSHIVTDITWTPLRPYQNWAEELKKLAVYE